MDWHLGFTKKGKVACHFPLPSSGAYDKYHGVIIIIVPTSKHSKRIWEVKTIVYRRSEFEKVQWVWVLRRRLPV